MFVRVSDKANHRYYKSLVYGLVNRGFFEQAIVINPYTGCYELVSYLEKADPGSVPADLKKTDPFPVPVYEIIQPDRTGWVTAGVADLLRLNLHLEPARIGYFSGYGDVLNSRGFLPALLERKAIPTDEAGLQLRRLADEQDWNYIVTQADADVFARLFAGFHDACLNKLVYEEDQQIRKVTAVFDNSGWYGIAELCFEGLVAMNLRPAQENVDRFLYGGSLLVKDDCIFWADDVLDTEDLSHPGSFIKALNLKWRKIG